MRGRAAGLGLAALVLAGAGRPAAPGDATRQASAREAAVEVRAPAGDTLVSATPELTVVATGFAEAGCDVQLTLQIATTADFSALAYQRTACGDSALFVPDRPLPSGAAVYWRALAHSPTADATSPVTGPRTAATWLRLISPNLPTGTTVEGRRPTFVWHAAPIAAPPGPWLFVVSITNVATRQTQLSTGLRDTVFVPDFDLESNTSYRWAVTASLPNGDSLRVASAATFVIVDRNAPLITLLYQNWPNPFPSSVAQRTCIWFDLAQPGIVRLDVYDIRGAHVRTLVPSSETSGELGAGRYGRATPGSDSGCDPRFSWDGTDAAGRVVPPGVYLVRLRGGGVDATRKMLFRGR